MRNFKILAAASIFCASMGTVFAADITVTTAAGTSAGIIEVDGTTGSYSVVSGAANSNTGAVATNLKFGNADSTPVAVAIDVGAATEFTVSGTADGGAATQVYTLGRDADAIVAAPAKSALQGAALFNSGNVTSTGSLSSDVALTGASLQNVSYNMRANGTSATQAISAASVTSQK